MNSIFRIVFFFLRKWTKTKLFSKDHKTQRDVCARVSRPLGLDEVIMVIGERRDIAQ